MVGLVEKVEVPRSSHAKFDASQSVPRREALASREKDTLGQTIATRRGLMDWRLMDHIQ